MLKNLCRTALAAVALTGATTSWAFTTDTITVESRLIPEPMRVTVITPDGAGMDNLVPVVYLLNGYGGDYRAWGNVRPDLGELADQYGVGIVCPSGMDSWYWDSPVIPDQQMETFFTTVLVPEIDNMYPFSTDPLNRAITGLSMGGHGALWLGTRHPDIWHNIGSTSGGVDIRPFPERWKMAKSLGKYEDNKERWETSTVINLVPQMKENGQNIIFDCGSEDFFADVNANLHQALLDAEVPHDYISRPGVHNSKYWANALLYQLLYFSRAFDATR